MTAAAAHPSPGRHLQIMFSIGGGHDLAERVLPQMSGWRGSGPVRVGNGAWSQPQLDVYSELLDVAFQLREQLGEIEPATRTFLIALADAAASQWEQPDNGIWEVRGLVMRYRTETEVDGVSGQEESFLLCTFWPAHVLAALPCAR